MSTVRIIATVKIAPHCVEEFIQRYTEQVLIPSQQEEGCLRYELWQNASDPTEFSTVEEWRDAQAARAHEQSSHAQAAMGWLPPFLAGMPSMKHYHAI